MLEVKGLTKHFGDLVAVDDVTFSVQPGEVLALLGPNGAGKTTTVRMLSAILQPTSGDAWVTGYDVRTEGADVRRNVGVLTEAPGLYTRMTGWEYLDFFGKVRGIPTVERRKRVEYLADSFRMTFALPRRLGEYSRGMSQKIALMRTLLHDPRVLLLDEPTSTMDPESTRLVRNTILQMREDDRRSFVICTHNLPEAEELADRIAIIRQGKILVEGTPSELKRRLLGPPLMEVHLGVPPRNGIVPLIEQYARVEEIGDTWVRYSTSDFEGINPAIVRALSTAEVPVVTLSKVTQSLESVYLRVVEEREL